VLSFLRYAEWPSGAAGPISIGVIGRPAFARVLNGALAGKSIGNRPVHVSELQAIPDAGACQVLYVASERAAEMRRILAAAPVQHMLTIGEADHFLDYGGAVNLLTVDGRMSFEVNLAAVERSGMSISSKLLRFGQVRSAAREGMP